MPAERLTRRAIKYKMRERGPVDIDRGMRPSEVADRLGPFYVYVLVDPRTDQIFYVGKGAGQVKVVRP